MFEIGQQYIPGPNFKNIKKSVWSEIPLINGVFTVTELVLKDKQNPYVLSRDKSQSLNKIMVEEGYYQLINKDLSDINWTKVQTKKTRNWKEYVYGQESKRIELAVHNTGKAIHIGIDNLETKEDKKETIKEAIDMLLKYAYED